MKDISVIILTHNESKHIYRCIRSVKLFAKEIFIVDSFSTDNTIKISKSLGARVYQNKWINYAKQFQWGLNNCPIHTKWVMRMDADEYVEPELGKEIFECIHKLPIEIKGIYLRRKVIFKGKWIKHGDFYPQILLRIWQHGYGRIEQRWMDEHIVLSEGKTTILKNNLIDENKNNITWWINKHNHYATREMIDLLNIKYHFLKNDDSLTGSEDPQAKKKRIIKEKIYSKTPLGVRPLLYFFYRYIIRLGFLDGFQGFIFHFMQGFWYRLLVDIKIFEAELYLKEGKISITDYLSKEYGLQL